MPVSRARIERLRHEGLLGGESGTTSIEILANGLGWSNWISRLLMLTGSALVFSGIIYFFAFNWAKMSVWMKFSAIEVAMATLALIPLVLGLGRTGGKVSLLGASVMVGVFLAVFGQVYQTGADAYQLFCVWAGLISPWVFISRFAGLWILWAATINAGIITCWTQMISDRGATFFWVFPICLLINSLFLGLREAFSHRLEWLSRRWHRHVLIFSVLLFADIPVFVAILDDRNMPVLLGTFLGLAANLLIVYRYSRRRPDPPALFMGVLSLCTLAEVAMGKAIFEIDYGAGTLFVAGIMTLGIFSAGVALFRRLNRAVG